MKFHWFAEVTYPHLEPDFPERFDMAEVNRELAALGEAEE